MKILVRYGKLLYGTWRQFAEQDFMLLSVIQPSMVIVLFVCKEHGLSVVTPGQDKGKKYAEWDAERKGTSWKAKLKAVIDATIPKAKDFDDFLRLMEAAGYEIKRGKFVSFRAPGQERFTRSKTLGEAYTVEAITERIAGTYRAKPKALRQEKTGVSMLIDIQNSIKAAESKGYEQWAKIHNLKQAAKTLNFLTEHDISEYEQLQAVLDEVHTESENTAATLKGLEKRLSDISLPRRLSAEFVADT